MVDVVILALTSFVTNIWSVSLLCVVLLACKWWRHPHRKFPPGVRGVPLFGVLPYLGDFPEKTLCKWSRERYGPVMSARFGNTDVVVISEYDVLQKAYVKSSPVYAGRPEIGVLRDKYKDGPGLTFRTSSPEQQVQRKFALRRMKEFEMQNAKANGKLNEIMEELMELVKQKDERAFDLKLMLGVTVGKIICAFSSGGNSEPNIEKLKTVVVHIFSQYNDKVGLIIMYSALKYVPPFQKAYNEFLQHGKSLTDFAKRHIAHHRAEGENTESYIDAFYKELKARNMSDDFHNGQLATSIAEFFSAGLETTTATVLWAILCAIHHPECQAKVQKELDELVGERPVVKNDKDMLQYTRAYIQEVYRFRTVAYFGVKRKTNEDTELEGYFIPKNTPVIPNVWAIHNDPKLWKNPEEFRPERHLDDRGFYVHTRSVIPYSVGARTCIGEKLARIDIFLLISNLIKHFRFLPDPDADALPEIDRGIHGIVFLPLPFKCVAKPR